MANFKIKVQSPSTYGEGRAEAISGAKVEFEKNGTKMEAFAEKNALSKPFGFITSCINEDSAEAIVGDELKAIFDRGYTADIESINGPVYIISMKTIESGKSNKNHKKNLSDDILTAKQRVINEGIMTESEVNEIINYLKSEEMLRIPAPDALIVRTLEQMKKWDTPVIPPKSRFIDRYAGVAEYENNSIVTVCLNKALNGQPTIYEGDKSVGKNVMAETISWLLHRPYGKITFGEKMSPEDLTGARTTAPSLVSKFSKTEAMERMSLQEFYKNGKALSSEEYEKLMEWEYAVVMSQTPQIKVEETPLVDAVRNGGVFIADEMNHGNANTVGSLNGLLDGSPTFQTAALGRIMVHPDFVFIATQNNGSKYTATNKLDAATMSRVGTVIFPYNESIKPILIEAVKEETRMNLSDAYFNACDKLYQGIKKCVKDNSISDEALNVRGFVSALNETASVMNGMKPMISLRDAIRTCVLSSCIKDRNNAILIGIIDKCIGTL